MSANTRQTDLFAGENWQAIYQAFTQINFNASDPPTIYAALRNYVQTNYPEDFNDWIESSEFVAIIELLSWLAGNLAFKQDISVRENFLDTAESRESVLRLARFLSYNPSRCQPSTGLLKLVQVSTDDDVYDSSGVNLSNVNVLWNDADDSDWYERFVAILSNAFIGTNPYGVPLKTGTIQGVATQLYRVNALVSQNTLGFSSTVSGSSMDFEVCNGDFVDGGALFERGPNPLSAFHLYSLNDGNGYNSSRTGFFLLFKQGSSSSQSFSISSPTANRVVDLNASNINQNDVWVQTVDDSGNVLIDWTQVPIILNQNISYNTLPISERNICQVLTRDTDQVSIRFSDGLFGNAPSGNLKVSYRVSNGYSYSIKPSEISRVTVPLTFVNANGALKTLNLTFSLAESVGNSAASETIAQIKQRAPLVYATQNRMVTGEDYNSFPLQTNLAVKLKAVNRVYSGQSRYFDLHDPTGTYQDLSIFAEDGIFFAEEVDRYTEVPLSLNRTPAQMIELYIQPTASSTEAGNAVRDVLIRAVRSGTIAAPTGLSWNQSTASLYTTTGWFSAANALILEGAMIQFSISDVPTWVAVTGVTYAINVAAALNTAGPVTLSAAVPTGSTVLAILPRYVATIPSTVVTAIETQITAKQSFSLTYDYATDGGTWAVAAAASSLGDAVLSGTLLTMITADYLSGLWRFTGRGFHYVFESASAVEWYDDGTRAIDAATGDASSDLVRIMRINENLNDPAGKALRRNFDLTIDKLWFYEDGSPEPRRTRVVFADSNADGYVDDPDTFYRVISATPADQTLFWSIVSGTDYVIPCATVTAYETEALRAAATPADGTVAYQLSSTVALRSGTFWTYSTASGWTQDFSETYSCRTGRGPNIAATWIGDSGTSVPYGDEIAFHWKHYATSEQRIDPASTSIQDMFVLTYDYDTQMRQWIGNGAIAADQPLPPSELDLRTAFAAMEEYRMFSDACVWRPVGYKLLFGTGASDGLRATFKVVRLPSASVSDGEIQTQIISAINSYFVVANWDFGETFFFTELVAFIHQQLAGSISSCVIVPRSSGGTFGDVFEVSSRPDEIFISTAQVSDVVIINSNTPANLRMR